VTRAGDQILLRLGDPPAPLPGPVASLLAEWTSCRDKMNTATNRNSRWLFPGRGAGQPMTANTLARHVTGIGVPTVAGRASAMRQHVMEMPASVVADALGYNPDTATRLAALVGSTFSRYAPGDRERPSPARKPGEGES
jgi:hypothetical protein